MIKTSIILCCHPGMLLSRDPGFTTEDTEVTEFFVIGANTIKIKTLFLCALCVLRGEKQKHQNIKRPQKQ